MYTTNYLGIFKLFVYIDQQQFKIIGLFLEQLTKSILAYIAGSDKLADQKYRDKFTIIQLSQIYVTQLKIIMSTIMGIK